MDVSYLAFRHHIRAFIDFILLIYVCVGFAISFGVRVFFYRAVLLWCSYIPSVQNRFIVVDYPISIWRV